MGDVSSDEKLLFSVAALEGGAREKGIHPRPGRDAGAKKSGSGQPSLPQ